MLSHECRLTFRRNIPKFSLVLVIAQAVSLWHLIATARVLSQVRSCGIFPASSHFTESFIPIHHPELVQYTSCWPKQPARNKISADRSNMSKGRNRYKMGRKTFHGGDYDGWQLGLMFSPENGGCTFLRNVDNLAEDCTESHPEVGALQSRPWKVEDQQSGMEIIESNPGRQLCGHQVSLPLTCRLLRPVRFRCRR